jgi:hypothetical protein
MALKNAEGDIVELHFYGDIHDLGERSLTSAAEHVIKFLYVHLGMNWTLCTEL